MSRKKCASTYHSDSDFLEDMILISLFSALKVNVTSDFQMEIIENFKNIAVFPSVFIVHNFYPFLSFMIFFGRIFKDKIDKKNIAGVEDTLLDRR